MMGDYDMHDLPETAYVQAMRLLCGLIGCGTVLLVAAASLAQGFMMMGWW